MGDIYCDVAVAATFRGDIQSARKRENKKGKEGNCHHQMVSDQSYNPLSSTMVVRTNFCYVLFDFSLFFFSNLILLFMFMISYYVFKLK